MKSFLHSVIVLVALSVISATDEDFDKRCIRACTDIYSPVCGHDGEKFRIFASECVMEVENCNFLFKSQRVFTRIPMRFCQQPWKETIMELYKNKALKSEKVDPKQKCLKACTLKWDPICGFDGEKYFTFGNKCDMEVQTCLMGEKKWIILRKGQC